MTCVLLRARVLLDASITASISLRLLVTLEIVRTHGKESYRKLRGEWSCSPLFLLDEERSDRAGTALYIDIRPTLTGHEMRSGFRRNPFFFTRFQCKINRFMFHKRPDSY